MFRIRVESVKGEVFGGKCLIADSLEVGCAYKASVTSKVVIRPLQYKKFYVSVNPDTSNKRN